MKENKVDIVCAGIGGVDVLVKGLPIETFMKEEMTPLESIQISVGGDPLNESIILSRLGKKVRFISKVGDDAAGRLILNACLENGIDAEYVSVSKEDESQTSVVIITQDGERNFLTNMRTGYNVADTFQLADVYMDAVKGAKVFSFGSLFINPLFDDEALCAMFKAVKELGVITCADMVAATGRDGFEKLKKAAPYMDYIFPNYEEGKYFSGKEDPIEVADYFLELGIGTVVLKLGTKGCLVRSREESRFVDAYLAEAVDTTGAGDNFAAGFICGLSEGKSMLECARLAAATSSIAVQSIGANTGVKSRAQVDAVIENSRLEGRHHVNNVK